jgi:MoxR-like ATPase
LLWINLQKENNNQLELKEIFSEEFLLERPLLQAIKEDNPPVLLIDEVDRADEAFEAYLLELLSEFQISIPELGTIKAKSIPYVILTSNGTRELSDALRRRCLFHYLDYPEPEREFSIIEQSIPNINSQINQQIVNFVHALRKQDLNKPPGIAETIDWSTALTGLYINDLLEAKEQVSTTLSCLLKTREDQQKINDGELLKLINIAV